MREHGVDVLVTKDSGGPLTSAKLAAAREEGVTVLVVRRPPLPAGVEAVDTVEAALARLEGLGDRPRRAWVAGDRPLQGTAVVRGALYARSGRQRW